MFEIVLVPTLAAEDLEKVGSKAKFWFARENQRWLFKASRPNTGEDWAEKVAAELCELLGLPHAVYELATWNNTRGVITKKLNTSSERLVLGNEVLAGRANTYPRYTGSYFYQIPQYTVDLLIETLSDHSFVQPPPSNSAQLSLHTAMDVFTGYLLLDAWIGNTDRHDQNWAVLEKNTPEGIERSLAPTFDHASSMGRELQDEQRMQRLRTKDKGYSVAAYSQRTRSAFFMHEDAPKPLSPQAVFRHVSQHCPSAASFWLQRLANITSEDVASCFSQVPPDWLSQSSSDFAQRLLRINRDRLLH